MILQELAKCRMMTRSHGSYKWRVITPLKGLKNGWLVLKPRISGVITLLKTGSGWKINTLATWPFRNAAILLACAACFSGEAFIERDSPHAIDSIEDSSSLQVRVRRVLFCVGKKKKHKKTPTNPTWVVVYFLNVHPYLGEMIQIDYIIFLRWGLKPPTKSLSVKKPWGLFGYQNPPKTYISRGLIFIFPWFLEAHGISRPVEVTEGGTGFLATLSSADSCWSHPGALLLRVLLKAGEKDSLGKTTVAVNFPSTLPLKNPTRVA